MTNAANQIEDRTLQIGAAVQSITDQRTGTVVREYLMPPTASASSYGFFSHPGRRVYVVRLDQPKGLHSTIAFGVGELEPTPQQ